MKRIAFVLVIVALLLSVSFAPADASVNRKVHRAEKIARHQIGDPYVYGAAGPNSFDCSGLVYYSYRKAGIKRINRTSRGQAAQAHRIKRSHMRPGDLMFFYSSSGVYHVGIFAGRHHGHPTMIHAPYPGRRVSRVVPWTNSWFAGTLR